ELPFIMSQKTIDISDVNGKMVQGIIDCLVKHEDKYIIIDYKTDNVTTESEKDLIERYEVQMEIYRRSIEEALNTRDDVYLYYFNYGVLNVYDCEKRLSTHWIYVRHFNVFSWNILFTSDDLRESI